MKKYTWKPDKLDFRDYKFEGTLTSLPSRIDLRDKYDLVFDQGQLGSCTANSISMAIDFERVKQGIKPMIPSRLFIYYNERVIEGTVKEDAGAEIRDGIKSVASTGVCAEKDYPYVIEKFKRKPSKSVYTKAGKNLVKQYLRIDNTNILNLKSCLAQGYPFVFGFSVYESFESNEVASNGKVPMPSRNESLLGGHAVICLGYDDATNSFIVRNSWGEEWGDKGHFYMPYAYLTNTNLADDFWTIRLV